MKHFTARILCHGLVFKKGKHVVIANFKEKQAG